MREATHLYESITSLQPAILDGSTPWEDVFHINWCWATYCYIPGSDAESQTFCTWMYNRQKKKKKKGEISQVNIHKGFAIILYFILTQVSIFTQVSVSFNTLKFFNRFSK